MYPLSERACRFLQKHSVGVFVSIDLDGAPQQIGIDYALAAENDAIVMHTVGRQELVQEIELSPWCSFCVLQDEHYVTLSGHVQIRDTPLDAQQAQPQGTLRLLCEEVVEYWGEESTAYRQEKE